MIMKKKKSTLKDRMDSSPMFELPKPNQEKMNKLTKKEQMQKDLDNFRKTGQAPLQKRDENLDYTTGKKSVKKTTKK